MKTLGEVIERNAAYFPQKDAIVFQDRRLTHGQFAARVKQLASGLYRLGMRRQDRAAILSMNGIEYFELFGACEWAGFVTATVNYRLAPPELANILRDAAPRVVLFEAHYTDVLDTLRPQLQDIEHFICIGEPPDWALGYEAVVASGTAEGPPLRSAPDDYAYLLYTSGTTGRPKGVVRTHRAMCAASEMTAQITEFTGASRVLQTTPAFHIGGKGFPNAAAWCGGTTILHRSFDPVKTLDTIQTEKVTFTFMVAAMLQAVLDVPDLSRYDLTSLQHVVTAAAPVPVPLLKRAMSVLGPIFSVQYGMTESNACALPRHEVDPYGTPDQIRRLGSVGHPCPGIELRIVDDTGQDCPVNVAGEVVLRSGTQLSAYWNDSVATVEALRDGWYHTGDMGYRDEAGYVFLVDRKKDMIISGGENVYSSEVENALLAHPEVAECAVIGVPHSKWGETVRAIVVCRADASLDEDVLIEHCRALIARYKCPTSIAFAPELPRMATGKIDKATLRKRYREAMAATAEAAPAAP